MENSDDELYFDISHKYGISNDLAAEMSKLAFNDLNSDIIVVCEGKPYFGHKVSLLSNRFLMFLIYSYFTGSTVHTK